jgi:hypothetical protein
MWGWPDAPVIDRDSKPATIKTILVLEDDVLVRKPVVQLLRECGYRVLEAASTGRRAWARASADVLRRRAWFPIGTRGRSAPRGR